MKKKLKIKFVDFNNPYDDCYIYQYLNKKYDLEICDDPDYIICSNLGYNYLKYDCIRIFYTGENICPNFNFFDYAIGFENLNFSDRYIRIPIYFIFDKYKTILKIAEEKHLNKNNFKKREKFCNMVCSNGLNKYRISFFKKLSNYKKVDSGGKILNNVGGPVENKLEFQKKYKFSIAFENSSHDGYVTEKIIDAYASGGIPIYWGKDRNLKKIFNEKSFIYREDFNSDEELIEYVKKVDNDDDLYFKYIKEPMLVDDKYVANEFIKLDNFLDNIFNQPIKDAYRRNNGHFVDQEKKGLLIVNKIINVCRPFLRFKSKIKNLIIK